MARRLRGFDYSRPYFYMVTLKREAGFPPFSQVIGDAARHYLEPSELTWLFANIIKTFHSTWFCIEPITCFSIMPDHIHLLIKLRATEPRVSLAVIVRMLMRTLEKAFFAWHAGHAEELRGEGKRGAVARSAGQHLFAFEWHDWIVARDDHLAAFTRYIRENPARSWLRRQHAAYFQRVNALSFLGRTWYGYGNPELLKLPVLEPFRCSRHWSEESPEWRAALARAQRLGPGCAGVSTFMSPCEKACGHALGLAGGRWVVLSPEGFGERWHPTRLHERFCAQGRMLYLSLWPAMAREPTKAELYHRCHEMGDCIMAGLAEQAEAPRLQKSN